MPRKHTTCMVALLAALPLAACESNGMGDAARSAGDTVASAAKSVGGAAVSLVNVDLSNVLNNLSLDLNLDKANIPVNAQIPITLAANVCGVSINILSVSTGGQANCTATTTSPELAQAVQQQIAAGGNVGGGAQSSGAGTATTGTATTGTTATGTPAAGTTGTTAPASTNGGTAPTTPTQPPQ